MRVTQVSTNFTGSADLKKGRKAFEALSQTEQVVKEGVEMFRQRFNQKNVGFKLSAPEGDLAEYVRYRISIANVVKKVTEKFRKPKY
ncbi:MAG: hypothetical protein NC200_06195 [Candidatus Gastranaerophilales bacterium]|nr:hypothetical protein [Candidatus Gastranaerophilales bacterium]